MERISSSFHPVSTVLLLPDDGDISYNEMSRLVAHQSNRGSQRGPSLQSGIFLFKAESIPLTWLPAAPYLSARVCLKIAFTSGRLPARRDILSNSRLPIWNTTTAPAMQLPAGTPPCRLSISRNRFPFLMVATAQYTENTAGRKS